MEIHPIVTLNDIREAQSRLRGVAVRTKLIPSHIHESDKVKTAASFFSSRKTCSRSARSSCGAPTTRSRHFPRTSSDAA